MASAHRKGNSWQNLNQVSGVTFIAGFFDSPGFEDIVLPHNASGSADAASLLEL